MFETLTAAVVVSLGCFLTFWAALHAPANGPRVRMAFVYASVVVGVAVFTFTELLSAIGALNEAGVLAAWLLLDGTLILLNLHLGWRRPFAYFRVQRPSRLEAGLIAGCVFVGLMTLIVALVAAPNNWDAMTYHMARVGYWVQSGSIEYHAAINLNRTYQGPLASYAMLNLFLLARGDQLVNLVDWASFIGSIVVASLVAAQLGAGKAGQALAGLVVATLPMAILQATSSQNHIVVAFWLLCLATIVLDVRSRVGWLAMGAIGTCLGLAVLTKGSAYAFAGPFVLWACVIAIRKLGWRSLPRIALVGVLAGALNAPAVARNFSVFGAPLGPSEVSSMFVPSAITPGTIVERAMQEVSLQLGTPFRAVDRLIGEGFIQTASVLGLDLRDPRVVQPTAPWEPTHMSLVEDNAGNLVAFLLMIGVTLVMIARHRGLQIRYLWAVAGSTVLYLALLRFTVWNSRWSLTLFVLAAPLVGAVIGSSRRTVIALLACVLLVGSTPWISLSKDRPLIKTGSVLTTGRTTQYFAMRPELEGPYLDVVRAIEGSGCRDIGYTIQADEAWEYPLWRLLNPTGHEVAIRDVMVSNATSKFEVQEPPCMIISFRGAFPHPMAYHGSSYRQVLSSGPMFLYGRI